MSQDDEAQAMYGWAYVVDGEGAHLLIRFSESGDELDEAFTRPLRKAFDGSPDAVKWLAEAEASGCPVPSLYLPKTDKLYLMHRAEYLRITLSTMTVDAGYPKTIGAYWPGMKEAGHADAIDAGLWWSEERAYFFKGGQYARYDLKADKVDEGFPKSIPAYWGGMKEAGFDSGIDAAVRSTDQKMYFFKGPLYLRYDIAADRVDPDYPRKTTDHWKAFERLHVRRVLSMWRAPRGAAAVPIVGGSESGSALDGIVEQTLAIHPNGQWLYAAGKGVIRCIPLAADGRPARAAQWEIVQCSVLDAEGNGLVVSPSGSHIYATPRGRNELLTFSLDKSGRLADGATGRTFTLTKTKNPGAIAFDARNNHLYITDTGGTAPLTKYTQVTSGASHSGEVTISWANGPLTPQKGLAVHPHGTVLYCADPRGRMFVLQMANDGTVADVGMPKLSINDKPGPLAVDPKGASLYYANREKHTLLRLPLASDGTIPKGAVPKPLPGSYPQCVGIAVNPHTRSVYVATGDRVQQLNYVDDLGEPAGDPQPFPFPPYPSKARPTA